MFEEASRLKLRFNTTKGILLVEDLWDLSLQELNKLAKRLNSELKSAEEEDFLENNPVDKLTKLSFDIVLHILQTKKKELDDAKDKAARNEERRQLLDILHRKKMAAKEDLSEEELQQRIAALE